ncbi:MAG: glycosyltransferase [Lachnospiraceae bacterium]|nr:glycosyltransferase [Lachnospiraceae bacterium]
MDIKDKVVIMIPAYNPDEKFLFFLGKLKESGYKKIIVIDDGSVEEKKHFFDEAVENYNCALVSHSINLGQGRAYKSGFNYYLSKTKEEYKDTIGIIQCDCDGQHCIEDVNKCLELLNNNPNKFILGVRNFSDKSIPFRSRFGNKCTTFMFKAFCGLDIEDTQTGLKGIPCSFLPDLMETQGERFEYASSVLLETKRKGIEILQFPIETIYINNNETSHFNPLRDSIRIYSLILKYLLSSISAFVVDIIMYSIFLALFKELYPQTYVIISTYLAKIISCTYTYMVNKKIVFENHSRKMSIAIKFAILCIIQSTLSGFLTNGIVMWLGWNEVLSKIIVDTVLFFVSFKVQDRWVFAKK